MLDKSGVIAKGQLRLYVKETGQEIAKQNLVIKNSSHITALAMGGDVVTTTVKVASWGDNFVEIPSGSYLNMTTLECLEDLHAIDGNHTIKELAVSGHSYPASKSVKFSFQFDRNSADELITRNLLEWGLYFNDVLYSRVALQEDFYFASWMTVVGEWTIIFMNCSGGYSNYILNQYEINSLWTMDEVTPDFEVTDYAGRNNLTGALVPAKLISNLTGISPYVNDTDFLHRDSLCTFYEDGGIPNVLYIADTDIYQKTLDLKYKFTLWQWFKFKDVDSYPFILTPGQKWVLFSKWVADSTTSQCSYRLYLERETALSTIDEVRLKFDINDGGVIRTIASDPLLVDPLSTINLFNVWCLAVVTFDLQTQKLTLYMNDEELASTTLVNYGATPSNSTSFMIGSQQLTSYSADTIDTASVFKGFVDETGISPETLNRTSVSLLWNNGYGDFYNP